ncbi:glycosyltransferase [Flavobacterium sp.]|uniref:glycosyltransferase n=1 Tax=Flavobacterium sp. TaxID=239 RepID=UPI00352906E9
MLGYVENIESYFLSSKFMIAPLRYGAGVKGKIGQAYEYFFYTLITTSIGAEGMNLKNNETALIANNTVEFAKNILKLYNDEELWNKLSKSSSLILEYFQKIG